MDLYNLTQEELAEKKKELKRKNVVDYYEYWETEAVKADLDTKRFNYSILCSNLMYDINISSVIRNANAFLASEVIIYGRKKWDRRGAVGTQNYTHFRHVREIDDLNGLFNEFHSIVGIDNLDNSKDISDYYWNSDIKTLICFGQEQVGLPDEVLSACDETLYIKQYGSVRSLNVGVASGIAMYNYVTKTQ